MSMMKKSLILFSILFSIVLFVFVLASSENLNVSCEVGGPYIKGATIIVTGNVTNITGTSSNVSIKINSSSVIATKNTTSDASGVFYTIFSESIDVGNYTVNATAERTGVYGNCTDDLQISSTEAAGVSVNKTITINGTAVYKDTGRVVTSGTAYLSIVNQTTKSTASIDPDGKFSISIYPLLTLGNKYYIDLLIQDTIGKKSWMQILFVTT